MKRRKDRNIVSVKGLTGIILGLSFFIQLIIILYTHFTGYYVNKNLFHFSVRWIISGVVSAFMMWIIVYADTLFIRFLNKRFPWHSGIFKRILVQFASALIPAILIVTLVTFVMDLISRYSDDLNRVMIYNAMIGSVVNIIIMIMLEAWFFFREGQFEKHRNEKLELELANVKFEVLKNQLNPHFMFNSLNVLSGLITKDAVKAQQFIDEFSLIYRYVLETIEKRAVTLKEELEFTRSYIFLQQMRYGESLSTDVSLDAGLLDFLVPPLSLQVLLENAIKHNIVNEAHPLKIIIYAENDYLFVKNNIQPRISSGKSTGVGQANLVKRYSILHDRKPEFLMKNNFYISKLPLIQSE